MRAIDERILENAEVRLEPLKDTHEDAMKAMVRQTGKAHWQYLTKVALGDEDAWFAWLIQRHRERTQHVYVIFDKVKNEAAGTSSFMGVEDAHNRMEIGSTWYVTSAKGTHVNPASKLLMVSYAFSDLGCNRVELKCDALNMHSRAAIRKLGAKEEGILREHMKVHDGNGGSRYRDTVYHSILASDWQRVREGLLARLSATHNKQATREKA